MNCLMNCVLAIEENGKMIKLGDLMFNAVLCLYLKQFLVC